MFVVSLFSFILPYVSAAAVAAVAVAVAAAVVAAVAAVAVADVAAAVAFSPFFIQSSDDIHVVSNAAQLRRVDGLDNLWTFWARSTGRIWCL